jgi:spoIIIJ-associated protein
MNESISVEKIAKSVEEAVQAALEELGLSQEDARIEILEEPKPGLFGLGAKQARVRVSRLLSEEDELEAFAGELFQRYAPDLRFRVERTENSLRINLEGVDPGWLIGKHGENINALQFLLTLALAHKGIHQRVVLDTGNYRNKREEALKETARKVAERVRRMRRSYTMPPLPPMERRVVHLALQDQPDVSTHSEGEEPYRKVVITCQRTGSADFHQRTGSADFHQRSGSADFRQRSGTPPAHRPSQHTPPPVPTETVPSVPSPMAPSKKWMPPVQRRVSALPPRPHRYAPPRKK